MNKTMSDYTRSLFVRALWVMMVASLLWAGWAVLMRYHQSVVSGVAERQKVRANLAAVRQASSEMQAISLFLNQHLGGEGISLSTRLFGRIDQIRRQLQPVEMKVSPLENTAEGSAVKFSMKLSVSSEYRKTVDQLGRLETEVFPFVSISSIMLQKSASPLDNALFLVVEGNVNFPALAPESGSTVNRKRKS